MERNIRSGVGIKAAKLKASAEKASVFSLQAFLESAGIAKKV